MYHDGVRRVYFRAQKADEYEHMNSLFTKSVKMEYSKHHIVPIKRFLEHVFLDTSLNFLLHSTGKSRQHISSSPLTRKADMTEYTGFRKLQLI